MHTSKSPSMTDPKAKAIPQWQRQEPTGVSEPSVPDQTPARPPPATEKAQAAVKAELLEQGTKWLEHEDIREAPLERKASFLESKGLNEAEIYEILEVSSHSNPPEQKTITSHSKTAVRTTPIFLRSLMAKEDPIVFGVFTSCSSSNLRHTSYHNVSRILGSIPQASAIHHKTPTFISFICLICHGRCHLWNKQISLEPNARILRRCPSLLVRNSDLQCRYSE